MSGGYIEYDDLSPLSPIPFNPDDDPLGTMLAHVRDNRDLYLPYKDYIFIGRYADLLNEAIRILFSSRREFLTTGYYQYVLPENAPILPVKYTVPVVRNVYVTEAIDVNMGNVTLYRQIRPLTQVETYNVGLFNGVPMYIGRQGSFLLSSTIMNGNDVDLILAMLRSKQ